MPNRPIVPCDSPSRPSSRLKSASLWCVRLALCLAFVASGPAARPALAAQTTLVATGSTWKYLDNGTDQGTAWRGVAFDDSSWASGPAELGYGDASEGRPEATVVSYGPNSSARYITTYFRKSFTVADPTQYQKLVISLLRDDGAVISRGFL